MAAAVLWTELGEERVRAAAVRPGADWGGVQVVPIGSEAWVRLNRPGRGSPWATSRTGMAGSGARGLGELEAHLRGRCGVAKVLACRGASSGAWKRAKLARGGGRPRARSGGARACWSATCKVRGRHGRGARVVVGWRGRAGDGRRVSGGCVPAGGGRGGCNTPIWTETDHGRKHEEYSSQQ